MVQLLIDPFLQPGFLLLQPFQQFQLNNFDSYIVDVFLPTEPQNSLYASDNVAIHHIFAGDTLHTFDQTLEIPKTIFATLDLIDYGDDPALESIVTFTVRNRNNLITVLLTV